jgi:O-antigen/teichoic acid export membrane protein
MIEKRYETPLLSLTPLKKNIAANFAGSIWQALMGLTFVPLYIKFMGIESYGLIGIFTTLQVIFGLLDVGLGSTLNREMARLSALTDKEQEMRNLVRTLESLYWTVAIFAGFSVMSLSPFIAHHWINTEQLPPETIEQALIIMGFVMVFQMPIGFYSGGLMGLQKQVLLNIINVCISTLRGVGAVLILWLVSPTIQAFLFWQILTSILNAFLIGLFLWRSLPCSENKAVFQKQLLKGIWKFTAGMSGISILAVILMQMDKIILSKMLSLEMYGYYTLASMVAMNLNRLFIPFYLSIYPRFTQLVALNDQDRLKQLYHTSCQFISILILPVAIIVALFSYEIILLWTQNPATAEKSHPLVSILICGTALNGLMHMPYALQLAFGWTKLSVIKNVIGVIVLAPLIIVSTLHYGATGAASVWLLLNIGYIFLEIPFMHRKILCKEKWQWYWQDVTVPFIVALLLASLGRVLFFGTTSNFLMFLNLLIISVITFFLTSLSVPTMRSRFYTQLLKFKLGH